MKLTFLREMFWGGRGFIHLQKSQYPAKGRELKLRSRFDVRHTVFRIHDEITLSALSLLSDLKNIKPK